MYLDSPTHEIPLESSDTRKLRVQDGHLFICGLGCCCGKTEKGFPFLALDEFKRQWKARGIRRRFHLTISGCLGPCTLANVVLMQFHGNSVWLHSINSVADVDLIYNYAEAMLEANQFLEPPPELASRHFQRYTVDTIDQSQFDICEEGVTPCPAVAGSL
jgi:hypothetical protein